MEQGVVNISDLKDWFTILSAIGGLIVVLVSGIVWLKNEFSNNKQVFFEALKDTKTDLEEKVEEHKKESDHTKEKVGLLEQTTNFHSNEITALKDTLEGMSKDLTSVRQTLSDSSHKSKEDTLNIMSEMKAMEGRTQLGMLELKENIIYTIQRMMQQQGGYNERPAGRNDSG